MLRMPWSGAILNQGLTLSSRFVLVAVMLCTPYWRRSYLPSYIALVGCVLIGPGLLKGAFSANRFYRDLVSDASFWNMLHLLTPLSRELFF